MQTCAKCKRKLPLDMFYRDRTKANGRNSYCKNCQSEYWRKWKAQQKIKEICEICADYEKCQGTIEKCLYKEELA